MADTEIVALRSEEPLFSVAVKTTRVNRSPFTSLAESHGSEHFKVQGVLDMIITDAVLPSTVIHDFR
jgi:hypothetical protein